MARILVPDYLGQQVLSGIRSLWRQGDEIDLASDIHWLQRRVFRSRAITRYIPLKRAYRDPEAYIRDLKAILDENVYDMLLPFGLGSYHILSQHKGEILERTRVLLPDYSDLSLANDKLASARRCQELGLAVPQIYSDYQEADLQAISRDVRYPVVVKARGGSGVQEGLRYARNQGELVQAYHDLAGKSPQGPFDPRHPLIQEFIPGYIHDACCLSFQGQAVNVLTQVRQVMYPVTGGVGAVNITTEDPVLKDLAVRVLEGFNWHGPAQIEFKFDPRDRKYKFIEFNPKLWGTLDLSLKAGMDFPGMIRDLCLDRPVPEMTSYLVGVRYIFRYKQFYRAKRMLKYVDNWKNIYQARPYTRSFVDFNWQDPLPDIFRMLRTIVFTKREEEKLNKFSLEYVLYGTENHPS